MRGRAGGDKPAHEGDRPMDAKPVLDAAPGRAAASMKGRKNGDWATAPIAYADCSPAKTGASKGWPLSGFGIRPGGRLSGACTSDRVRWRVLLFIWLRQNGPALPSQWAGFVCPARIAAALAVSSALHAFGVSLMQLRALRRTTHRRVLGTRPPEPGQSACRPLLLPARREDWQDSAWAMQV